MAAPELPQFAFDNRYARELEGLYVAWPPSAVPQPTLVRLNQALAAELGLDAAALARPGGVAVLAGNAVPAGAQPLAQAYAGHQFGGFSAQLGDGRALLLGEVIDTRGRRRDIALKGSGRTPFSRGGDGKAALGPVLREYLVGEAMHALGIPTTRALAAVSTGEPVQRERELPGAVLTRVAASHIRVGTFQFFAARDEPELVRRLAEHVISRHDPDLVGHPTRYLQMLQRIADRQAALIAQWMGVGFIHGVMNTDNMTVSGETIDYGPCAFMEAYRPATVFSSIDTQGRYAYGNQPLIARWNLARLAETLIPLLAEEPEHAVALATAVINDFPARYQAQWLKVMRGKLGLPARPPSADGDAAASDAADQALAEDFLQLLHTQAVDFTLGFRRLADAAAGRPAALQALFADKAPLEAWLAQRAQRCAGAGAGADGGAAAAMARCNPALIARNHQVELALAAAVERGDLAPFERLLAALQHPFDERAEDADLMLPAPPELTAGYRTFCGT